MRSIAPATTPSIVGAISPEVGSAGADVGVATASGADVGVLVGAFVGTGVDDAIGVAVAHTQLELVVQLGFLQTPT